MVAPGQALMGFRSKNIQIKLKINLFREQPYGYRKTVVVIFCLVEIGYFNDTYIVVATAAGIFMHTALVAFFI